MRQTRRIKKREGIMAGGAQQPGGTHAEILLEKPTEEPPQYQWPPRNPVAEALAEVAPMAIAPGAEMLQQHAQEMAFFVQDLMDNETVPPQVVAKGVSKLATILAEGERTLTDLPRIRPPHFTPIRERNAAEVKRLGVAAARERNANPTFRAEVAEAVRLGMPMSEVREAYGIGWETMYGILDEAGVPRPQRGKHHRSASQADPFTPSEESEMPTPPPTKAAPANGVVQQSANPADKSWRITFIASTTKTFTAPTLDEAIALVREGYGEDVDITNIGRA
jgi:hypothetical protein